MSGTTKRTPWHVNATTADRESRLRRSMKRLGYDLVDADHGQFYIRREGRKVNETADLFAGIEQWIRKQAKG
jgi:hypothetical protein